MSRPRPTLEGLHTVQRETGSEIDHADMAFLTSSVPDIPVRNRMVAVCGIADHGNAAAPQHDGWFFSDFFLFHHLLHPVCTRSTDQIWLTCEDPRRLVEKYGEYAHGDPRHDRRVVLDKTIVPFVESWGNLRVVARDALKERFLSTVREQAALTVACQETLILLILGHGDSSSFGVYLGGKVEEISKAIVTASEVRRVLPQNASVTLLMTSCFSGGWLVQPKLSSSHLNVTGIAAAGPLSESHSWSISKSAGRACGSTIASAIVNNMIDIETAEDNDPRLHPTYAGLVDSIYKKANELDGMFSDQNVHFSAQNDEWEANWSPRTGVPLTRFRERWEMLKNVPPGSTKDPVGAASDRRYGVFQNELTIRAHEYFAAKPGLDNSALNVGIHTPLILFFRGRYEPHDENTLRWVLDNVVYRLSFMHEVDEYVQGMGLSFPSCLGFSVEDYKPTPEKKAVQQKAHECMRKSRFLDPPPRGLREFTKPIRFLAIVFAETCEENQIEGKLEEGRMFKKQKIEQLLPRVHGPSILNDTAVVEKREFFKAAMRKLGQRVNIKALGAPSSIYRRNRNTKIPFGKSGYSKQVANVLIEIAL